MERLTHKARYEAGYKPNKGVKDWQVADRLGAYENTELTPDQIMELKERMNDGWIPVEERLPEPGRIVLITQTYSWEKFEEGASVTIGRLSPKKNNKMWEFQYYNPDFRSGTIMDNDIICPGSEYVIAWRPLPEPYRPKKESEGSRRLREREEFFKE